MPLILGTNSIKDTGYDVANSARFDGSNDTLNRTPSSAGNRKTWTWSGWIKFSDISSANRYITSGYVGSSNTGYFAWYFHTDSKLTIQGWTTNFLVTTQVFRDPTAWQHLVIALDTTQGTASNRLRVYLNGSEITFFSTDNRSSISQNSDLGYNGAGSHVIGGYQSTGSINAGWNGYLTEIAFIDGQQLAPDQFGEFDEDSGIWKPIDVSGLTFGNNGFYLDFEDSSALGNDAAGSNNFTVNNLTAIDSVSDVPTNNFATLNPLDNYYAASTFSEGNCKIVTTSGNITYNTSTIGFSSGKWYIENKVGTSSGSVIGVVRGVSTGNNNDNKIGNRSDGWGYDYRGLVEHNGSDLGGSFATYSAGDIIGVYIDLDNNELYFAKNGTLQNSGTGLALTAGTYFFATGDNNSGVAITHEVNFGNPTFSISSGNTDAGGYGNFEYDPSSGTFDSASKDFLALCTKNLAEYG